MVVSIWDRIFNLTKMQLIFKNTYMLHYLWSIASVVKSIQVCGIANGSLFIYYNKKTSHELK